MNDILLLLIFLENIIYVSLYCDDIVFLNLVDCPVVSRCRLLWLHVSTVWCNFIVCFIFFFLPINVDYPFHCSTISYLTRLRFISLNIRLACHLVFDFYICSSYFCRFHICGYFLFCLIPLQVRFPGVIEIV